MKLSEKEKQVIKDLQTQELGCAEKYKRYSEQAKDEELKNLFQKLQKEEEKHYNSLEQVLSGCTPKCNCNDSEGKEYEPKATYNSLSNSKDKETDSFLATDCIGSEKLISSEYNNDVFNFEDADVRKLLEDIQIEEQNHAEMLYKYKQANAMA